MLQKCGSNVTIVRFNCYKGSKRVLHIYAHINMPYSIFRRCGNYKEILVILPVDVKVVRAFVVVGRFLPFVLLVLRLLSETAVVESNLSVLVAAVCCGVVDSLSVTVINPNKAI